MGCGHNRSWAGTPPRLLLPYPSPNPQPDATKYRHLLPPRYSKHNTQISYVWEEPLLPPRLLVRVGPDFLQGGDLHRGDGGSAPAVAAARLQAWGVGRVSSEEAGTLSGPIKLIRYW